MVDEKDYLKRVEILIGWLNTAKEILEKEDLESAFNQLSQCSIEIKRILEVMNRK